jgi:hypothetical protein
MNAADVVSEFGAYYLNHGQGRKDLAKILHYKAEFDELFTTTPTDDTVIRKGSALMGRLLQPFQKTWSPTGSVTFQAESIPLYKQKVDFQDYPDELEQTWLGFLADGNLDRKQWPFVKWLIEQHIVPRLVQDHELNEVYAGVYAAPGTPGTAGAVSTAMEGVRKIINDHITATRITPITTGALSTTPATFVAQVEAFADAISPLYRSQPMTIAMNFSQSVIFKRGMRAVYNTNYDQASSLMSVMDYPNLTIKGFHAMGNSGKLIATPKENAIRGVKNIKNLGSLQVENVDRQVKIYNDFHVGVGYVIPEIVFTNNVDTV